MSIKIGDGNKISKSTIGHQHNRDDKEPNKRKGFLKKHPIIVSILITLFGGILFTLPFWTRIGIWIEGLFK